MPEIKPPPVGSNIADDFGIIGRQWRTWFQQLILPLGNGPFPLKSYAVADVPGASGLAGHIIFISNESGGAQPAFSDGTNWRRFSDRAIIS